MKLFRIALPLSLVLAACAAVLPPSTANLTVERGTIDPPAGAILERVVTYSEADASEDPTITPTALALSGRLAAKDPLRVEPLRPLATGGVLYVYYLAQTRADTTLTPETIDGRILAAELLGEALSKALTP